MFVTTLLRPCVPTGTTLLQVAAATMAVATSAALAAQTTIAAVSPADRSTLAGSGSTAYPLGRFDARYQQLFLDLGKVATIKGHAYRRQALGSRGVVTAFQSSLSVTLSSTTRQPDAISKNFADNIGGATTAVLPQTWVSFPQTDRPTTAPGAFEYQVPYRTPFVWTGKDTLCVDITLFGNQGTGGADQNFNPSLDAQQLYTSSRNLQPGYPFGSGCQANANSGPASCTFEIRHLGPRLDLEIVSRAGVPSTTGGPAQTVLLLSPTAQTIPWPPGTGCNLYGVPTVVLPLQGDNDAKGDWAGVIDVGLPPPPFFSMIGQVLSTSPSTRELVLSDGSRLITPPPGLGVVSARVISASDRTALSGTVSFAVPITGVF